MYVCSDINFIKVDIIRGDRKSGINDREGNYYQPNFHTPAYKGFACHRG